VGVPTSTAEIHGFPKLSRLPLATIDSIVSGYLGLTRLKGNAQPSAFNRQIAMYLAKHVRGWSTTAIGNYKAALLAKVFSVQEVEAMRDRTIKRHRSPFPGLEVCELNVRAGFCFKIDRFCALRANPPGVLQQSGGADGNSPGFRSHRQGGRSRRQLRRVHTPALRHGTKAGRCDEDFAYVGRTT
jgi:hypothetical protein